MSNFNNPLFDQIKEDLLRDFRGTLPVADTSEGSVIYAESNALASAIWGLYKNQSFLKNNMVPDAPNRDILERWARIYGISTEGKTSEEILSEFIDRLRKPAAGGNKADIERWAREVSSNGLLDFPLERTVPALITNSGLANFSADNFTDGDEMSTAFSTGGVAANSYFLLDYGVSQSEELISLGMWKYNDENVSFKIEYSEDDSTWNTAFENMTLSGLGWSFASWDSVGSFRYWRVSLIAVTTNDINIGEIEFYYDGVESVDSATCYSNSPAIGTFRLVCARNETRISNKLLEGIFDYLEYKCPVAPKEFWVIRPKELAIDVTLIVTSGAQTGVIETEIRNYIFNLEPGDPFYLDEITFICRKYGSLSTVISNPTNDVFPTAFEEVVENSISVTVA